MMGQPTVSIICTVYNKAPWLERVIEGFLAQETNFEVEIILVDDYSTDSSRDIITSYKQQYSDMIQAIFHEENQGISRTWVSACQHAKGKYIARCDGDDFWLDPHKLQKQVDLLEGHPEAKWSNTDFDIYDENGQLVSRAGFASGSIPLVDTYAKMLATRGFTMASTWVVERELILEVNQELDLTTADDTFNLQLDLFQRTQLLFLPEATVAYTINQGSDSRPVEFAKIENRFNTLLATQKSYLDKYPASHYREMLDILLERNNTYEVVLTKKERGLAQVGIQEVTIYFDKDGTGFCQENALSYPLMKDDELQFKLPYNCQRLRIDLSEQPSFYRNISLVSQKDRTTLLPAYTNGILVGDMVLFPQQDPQLIYEISPVYGADFILKYTICELDDLQSSEYVAKILGEQLVELQKKVIAGEQVERQLREKEALISRQQKDLEHLTALYHSVVGSRRWIIPTKIINVFRRKK
ncbi:TPA: glycosyltransferase [Streptococcus suis]|nr:glycosyltransferase [Streptococcus suis]